jgi:hypothetical protein
MTVALAIPIPAIFGCPIWIGHAVLYSAKNSGPFYLFCFTKSGITVKERKEKKFEELRKLQELRMLNGTLSEPANLPPFSWPKTARACAESNLKT